MTTTDATYRKEIRYDRETRDYAMYLDGELVGFARTYHEAEVTLDQVVFELLSHGATATASALDGDSDADECATCDGEGRIPVAGYGDQAGGWAETCPDCGGHSPRQRCLLCGGDHSAENCPRIHPIDATDLLMNADAVIGRLYCPNCLGNHLLQDCPLKRGDHTTEVDALLEQLAPHPGPNCSCPACMHAAERLIVDAFMARLRFDAGVLCSFCGDDHADSACPQKRPLLAPRVCGNCGGQHSIQQCSDIRRLLFAA